MTARDRPTPRDAHLHPSSVWHAIRTVRERIAYLDGRIAEDEAAGAKAGFKHKERAALLVALPLLHVEMARQGAEWRRIHPKRETQPWELDHAVTSVTCRSRES